MVVVDLEDAVEPERKTDETRTRAADALTGAAWHATTLAVRINDLRSEWWERDVEIVTQGAGSRLDCVVVPKVESPEDVRQVADALSALGSTAGIEAQIESARGLVEVERIAGSSERLETLVFGPGDFAASIGVPQRTIGALDPSYPGDQWHYARSRISAAAHAFGLQPIDGPYADFDDPDGLRESARRARLLGFQGKWVIHPAQIEIANEAFSPTPDEIEHARAVLAALREQGVARLDGTMVDEASARLARAVLERAGAA